MFRWTSLACAIVAFALIAWMVNDLRLASRKSVDSLNANLPEILQKSKITAKELAELAEDVKQLKDLAGFHAKLREKNLIAFADSLLDKIENTDGFIGKKKFIDIGIGSSLTDKVTTKEWVTGARKEALWIVFWARSRREVLEQLTKSAILGRTWYIEPKNGKISTLLEWLQKNHAEAAKVKMK